MQAAAPPRPIEKNIVLVGAGNAHLVFLRRWGMRPDPAIAVTLVNEAAVVPYSAMVPAHVAGDYIYDQITIDLVRLCQAKGVRFVQARVTGIDPVQRNVLVTDRPPLSYDALSLGLGSLPSLPPGTSTDNTLLLRPLGALLAKLSAIEEALRREPRPFHLVVVGGGASGCELSLAIRKRLRKYPGFRLTLLHGERRLLPNFPESVSVAFDKRLRDEGIEVQTEARVLTYADGVVRLRERKPLAADAVLWATQATASPQLKTSGLSVNEDGFLHVRDTLQSVDRPEVFGSGDCVAFETYPDLPRNGVYAVREGPVLHDNMRAFLHERPLRPFRPRPYCLYLLNTADGQAVLNYGPLTWKSRLARALKDRIDRAWIDKFTRFPPMQPASAPAEETMRCGGCGSKIASDVLSAVLRRLPVPDDPRMLLGCQAGEDAAVYRLRPELFGHPDALVEVQTVDYFRAFVSDPYLFGRIAAQHAVSDLYAMNARPFSALAIATLPYARSPVQEAQLFELLSGALVTLREAGMVLAGGHTTEGSELSLGFAVTGFGEEGRLFQKNALRPGDMLILTKPLGSGALLAAWMRGECRAGWFQALVEGMLQSNGRAAEIFARGGVQACTDITGFGLAGHLLEMLDASSVSAQVEGRAIPLYPGLEKVLAAGIVSSLQRDNAKLGVRVQGTPPAWFFDPQTSGGLLAGVPAADAAATVRELRAAGCAQATVIGRVIPASASPGVIFEL